MRNKIYQFLWFKIVKKIVPVSKTGDKIGVYYNRMVASLYLASLCGGVKRIVFGDSNVENQNTIETMSGFKSLTINWGHGGSTLDDWMTFFSSDNGKKIYEKIKYLTIIINLGGNNILLNKIETVPSMLDALKRLFPLAWFANVPAIHSSILSELSKSLPQPQPESYYTEGAIWVNKQIDFRFEPRVLNLYAWTLDIATGKENPIWMKDIAHYNDFCFQKLIVPIENCL